MISREILKRIAEELCGVEMESAILERLISSYERLMSDLHELEKLETLNVEPSIQFKLRKVES